jgi:outer membrane protein TolC
LTDGYSDRGGGGAARSFLTRDSGLYQTGFDAAYEIDVFGGARASVSAAEADAQASEEAARGTLVTVTSETAGSYLALREAQERLAVARKTLRRKFAATRA